MNDSHGRRITYLRLSVTDTCNLRCRYCVPGDHARRQCYEQSLPYEDLLRIARCAVELGIGKIRVTGGEPLVRTGLVGFLGQLSEIRGLDELVLTTNGILLERYAAGLRAAGVDRLNVSLDSLNPVTFRSITEGGSLARVLGGLKAAEQAGFPPPKINVVVMRDINDEEVLDFAALTMSSTNTVRFIEYMPTGGAEDWRKRFVSGGEILRRIESRYRLEHLTGDPSAGPARNFRIVGAKGTLGVVTAVSSHFCQSCNRIRITSAGVAKGCLFGQDITDLKPYLGSDCYEELKDVLRRTIIGKPSSHHIGKRTSNDSEVRMYKIGG